MSEWFVQEPVPVRKKGVRYALFDVLIALFTLGQERFPRGEGFWKLPVGPKTLETTRAARDSPGAQKSLFDLMCLYRSSIATDPQDEIYALVVIGSETKIGNLETSYHISQYAVAT